MSEKEIKEFTAKRGLAKSSITRLVNFADKITDKTPQTEIAMRLEYLERAFSEFMECETKLAKHDIPSELAEYETKYFSVKAKFLQLVQKVKTEQERGQVEGMMSRLLREQNEFLSTLSSTFTCSLNQTIQNTTEEPHCSIRLPTLRLPKFSGKYEDFPSFKDIFVASVHSKLGFNDVQKFQYLKGQLDCEAAELIKHITVSDANYKQAWEKICERYDKGKLVLSSMIRSFIEQPAMQQASVKKLRQLFNGSDEVNRGITVLGGEATKRDPWLIYILLNKTDPDTREAWAHKTVDTDYPSYEEFSKFLSDRCDALESCAPVKQSSQKPNAVKSHQLESVLSIPTKCLHCNGPHRLCHCDKFKSMNASDRRELTAKLHLCFNCLSNRHRAINCLSKLSCLKCARRHHTLLHDTSPVVNTVTVGTEKLSKSSSIEPESSTVSSGSVIVNTSNIGSAILPTAVVRVKNSIGHISFCRVLLDSGSQASFISKSCAHRLNLNLNSCRLRIEGIATSNVTTMGSTSLTIHSRFDMSESLNIKVFVLPKITTLTANSEVSISEIKQLPNCPLSDPKLCEKNEIDILLGADYFFHILKPNQIQVTKNVIAQETIFGYVIAGMSNNGQFSGGHSFHMAIIDDYSLDQTLQKFWEQEEILDKIPWTTEEESCESHFKKTYSKNQDGRFIVQLPLKPNSPRLGESFKMALQRLMAMERKMNRNPEFGIMYREFMEEYLNMGHMRAVQNNSESCEKEICYLPHHGVLREKSATTKLRVVFDGSAPTSTGTSLNQKLLVGPTLQDTLWTILVRFRSFKVALCADIAKMYRQILVNEKHTSLQRIIWRKYPNDPIIHYELLTVTYGTSSAPFLAIRVLQQISEDCKQTFPEVSNIILKNFYVDDLLAGAATEEQAWQLKRNILQVLSESGFSLRKWHSNISSLNDSNDTTQIREEGKIPHILGLLWDSQEDKFSFEITNMMPHTVCSKRNILSIASRIFDPLGWLNPFIINIKIFMQTLWLRKVSWDEPLTTDLQEAWSKLYNQFHPLNQIRITRFIGDCNDDIQLHGFSDASEVAYSAAVYVRTKSNGKYVTRLLTAKSKVAPIKQISLPRLELSGAHLLAKLVKAVLYAYDKQNLPIWLWTDSMVVLAWLNSHPYKWKNYIANRVGAIHTLMPDATWRHVKGSENPADLATRGVSADKLIGNELWFNGPKWLAEAETNWPTKSVIFETVQEARSNEIKTFHAAINSDDSHPVSHLLARCSNWLKVIRIMAYIFRFIYNFKEKVRSPIQLRVLDLNYAELTIIRQVQQTEFKDDIKSLNKYKHVPVTSKLKQLAPFLDSNNVLRVGGRLEKSECSYDIKHPLILPKNHQISCLILNHLHKKHLHPGPSLLTALSRQKYWILGVREMCRNLTRKCVTCYRYSTLKSTQQIGCLPEARVTPSRPFSIIGIDYAGPILLASKVGRGARLSKGFIVIFVCFATKAIHIEVASSLTTQAFISALDRFAGRRGVPKEIYSDNGSNFLGAKRLLHEYYAAVATAKSVSQINEFATNKGIVWHLIPPLSPHFGGIWERAVKSVKTHLVKLIGNAHRTFEETQTILIQIEGILNSRPLCTITNEDTCHIDALTPGHFLTLGPITALPHANYDEINTTRLNRWEQTQKIVQSFWKRYSIMYLNTLQQRTKWQQKNRNLQVDDVVLLYDKNAPPCTWLLGRIIELHAGSDGLVRVVTVQTKTTTFKRPITKLFRLPITD